MLKEKNICAKKLLKKILAKKKLWTFEWPKMNHIFISPYHNHFWVDFNFYFLTCTLIFYLQKLFFIWTFSFINHHVIPR